MTHDYGQPQLLVELAAITAYHCEPFLKATTAMSRSGVETYWVANRNRLETWAMATKELEIIARHQSSSQSNAMSPEDVWQRVLPLIEEVLASELLTRIWAAIGCELDRRQEAHDVEPFVRSVLVGHLETRHRLLRLVFNKLHLTQEQLRKTDRIRRRTERWADVLMGYLHECCDVSEFAFDINRVTDFSNSFKGHNGEATSAVLLASLRATFQEEFSQRCPNPQQNSRICEAVMSCFSSDIFDSTGSFSSLWELRLHQAATDTQGMIDCLAAEHDHRDFPPHRSTSSL